MGRESCTMADIKNYKGKSKSVSTSQILFTDYTYDKAKIVMEEMIRSGAYELMRRHVMTNKVNIYLVYSKDIIPPTKGHVKMTVKINVSSKITPYVMRVFEQNTNKDDMIR